MGVNLGVYYPGGVPLKTTYYCFYCHTKMESSKKDKTILSCAACKQEFKDPNPQQDDELLDYQKFDDKF